MFELKTMMTDKAKVKAEEAYGLTGQELSDAINLDLKRIIKVKLKQKRESNVKADFDFKE